jgi:hypothetical protein
MQSDPPKHVQEALDRQGMTDPFIANNAWWAFAPGNVLPTPVDFSIPRSETSAETCSACGHKLGTVTPQRCGRYCMRGRRALELPIPINWHETYMAENAGG